jgi:hypothetical protein
MSTVLAYIEEGADLSVAIAEDQHILVQDVAGDVAARLAQHRDMADILPAVMKDLPLLELEDRRIKIIVAGQSAGPSWIAIET